MTSESQTLKSEVLKVAVGNYSIIIYSSIFQKVIKENVVSSLPQKGHAVILPRYEIKIVKKVV